MDGKIVKMVEKAHSAPLKPAEKHVSFVDPKRGHFYLSPHGSNVENVPFEQDQVQLWVNVIEGIGFSSHLRETHVSLRLGDIHVSGKHATHDTDKPKWGETFLVGRCSDEEDLVIEIRATPVLQCSTLMEVKIPVQDIIDRGDIFQWWTATGGCKGQPHSTPAILVHIRVLFSPTTIIPQERLTSLRIEMATSHAAPGGILKGCIVYNANRARHFTKAKLKLRHRIKQHLETTDSDVDDDTSSTDLFYVKTPLPHEFDTIMSPGAQHSSFSIAPGTYYWPFIIQTPPTMQETGIRKSGSNTHVSEMVEFTLCISFTSKGGAKKRKTFPLTVEHAAAVNHHGHDQLRRSLKRETAQHDLQHQGQHHEEDNANSMLVPHLPRVKFFSKGPFTPDRCDYMGHVASPQIRRTHGGVDCRAKIPSAGCCASVNRALYALGH